MKRKELEEIKAWMGRVDPASRYWAHVYPAMTKLVQAVERLKAELERQKGRVPEIDSEVFEMNRMKHEVE